MFARPVCHCPLGAEEARKARRVCKWARRAAGRDGPKTEQGRSEAASRPWLPEARGPLTRSHQHNVFVVRSSDEWLSPGWNCLSKRRFVWEFLDSYCSSLLLGNRWYICMCCALFGIYSPSHRLLLSFPVGWTSEIREFRELKVFCERDREGR